MATATATKKVNVTLKYLMDQTPRITAQIRDPRTVYLGPCVVQVNGGWTRVGPTWLTPVGWVVIGPGVYQWGTTQGLAELATFPSAKPTWHSIGVGATDKHNIIYAITKDVLATSYMADVAALTAEAEKLAAKSGQE